MFEFLKHLFPTDDGAVPDEDRRLVDFAIEAIVDRTDPRLRVLADYRRRLAPAVEEAILHTRLVVARLRPPVAMTRQAFAADPLVHLLFGTAESIGEIAGRDRNVRTFLASPQGGGAEELFALLLAGRREKTVFGSRLEAGLIVADVPQRMLSFTHHRLHAVSRSEAHTLSLMGRIVFRQLIRQALEQMRARRWGFAETAVAQRHSPPSFADPGEDPFSRSAWTAQDSRRQEDDARWSSPGTANRVAPTLEDYLDDVVAVMAEPARHLHHMRRTVAVDRMGVLGPGRGAADGYEAVSYWEATPDTGVGPLATVLVRIPVGEMPPLRSRDSDPVL